MQFIGRPLVTCDISSVVFKLTATHPPPIQHTTSETLLHDDEEGSTIPPDVVGPFSFQVLFTNLKLIVTNLAH